MKDLSAALAGESSMARDQKPEEKSYAHRDPKNAADLILDD